MALSYLLFKITTMTKSFGKHTNVLAVGAFDVLFDFLSHTHTHTHTVVTHTHTQ